MNIAEISKTKRIGEILLSKGYITDLQHSEINHSINKIEYKGLFYCDIAIALKYITEEQKNQVLKEQSLSMLKAAISDLTNQTNNVLLEIPNQIKNPHFGNQGAVSEQIENPNYTDSISSCANLAKIVVQIYNVKLENKDNDFGSITNHVKDINQSLEKLLKFYDEQTTVIGNTCAELKAQVDGLGNYCDDHKLYKEYMNNRLCEIEHGIKSTNEKQNNKFFQKKLESESEISNKTGK